MHCLIPNKNKIFEEEKIFLEEKHRQGFKLEKKGLFFYRFTPVPPQEAIYEMDLLSRKITANELQIGGWEIVETKQIFYKRLKKIYYLSLDPDNRLLVDMDTRSNYYNFESFMWPTLCHLLWMFAIFASVLPNEFPDLFPDLTHLSHALYLGFALSLIFAIIRSIIFSRGVCLINGKLEKGAFPLMYFVQLKNLSPSKREEVRNNLSIMGHVVSHVERKDSDYYRLISPIPNVPKLRREIVTILGVEKENLVVGGAGLSKESIYHNDPDLND